MPRGGARVRSGPTATPGSIRSGRVLDRSGIVHLPAAGRDGEAPAWPLPGRMSKWESERWAEEWRRPQALMWEQLGLEVQVALYVRNLRLASSTKAAVTRTSGLMAQMNNLGLTADAMKRLGWVIDEAPPEAGTVAAARPAGTSAKDRIRVIQGGADARAS